MEQSRTNRSEHTHALLAEQGIHVTNEGVARARQKLREADERMTPEAWARIDQIFGLGQPAA
jgi:hypothetical protein